MAHDPCAYLWDAREACDAIREFVAGVDLHTYMETPLLHSAVERKFEIIGEALNQLSKVDPVLAAHIPGLARIVAFRMFWDEHAPPHFHVTYGEYKATVNISALCISKDRVGQRSWFLTGRNCTRQSCWLIGIYAKPSNILIRLLL